MYLWCSCSFKFLTNTFCATSVWYFLPFFLLCCKSIPLSLFSFCSVQRDGGSLPVTLTFRNTSICWDIARIRRRCFCSSGERSRDGQSTASSLHCKRLSVGTPLTSSGPRLTQSTKPVIHNKWCTSTAVHYLEALFSSFTHPGAVHVMDPFNQLACLWSQPFNVWTTITRTCTLCSITRQY